MEQSENSGSNKESTSIEDSWRQQICLLKREFDAAKGQLKELRKRNTLLEHLYSKTKGINDELQNEITILSKLIENYKKKQALSKINAGTQVVHHDLITEIPNSEPERTTEELKEKEQILIENYKKKQALNKKNVGTQVFDYDVIADMSSSELHGILELERTMKVPKEKQQTLVKKNVGTQVFDYDIIAEMPQSEIHRTLDLQHTKEDVKTVASTPIDVMQNVCEQDQPIISDWIPTEQNMEEPEEEGELKEESVSVAESVRQAAESAMQHSNYVYDESSGMFYDQDSGYYYDSERQLFYEPTEGVYYSYDAENQTYNEYSRVDLSQYYAQQGGEEVRSTGKRDVTTDDPNANTEEPNVKPNKKQKTKASKTISYSSGAKTYSKDLKDRRVTETDLRWAAIKPEAKLQISGDCNVHTSCHDNYQSDFKENVEWRLDDNDYFNHHEYEKEINKKHVSKNKKVIRNDQTTNTSLPSAKAKPFIGPVIPTECLMRQSESKDGLTPGISSVNVADSCETAFIGPIKPSESGCQINTNTNDEVIIDTEMEIDTEKQNDSPAYDKNSPLMETDADDNAAPITHKYCDQISRRSSVDTKVTESIPDEADNKNDSEPTDFEDGELTDSEFEEEVSVKGTTEEKSNFECTDRKGEGLKSGSLSIADSDEENEYCLEDEEENVPIAGSQQYPPCIRLMVHTSEHLSAGSLYVVTCSGATIGREEGLGHAVLIPDINVSKMHCSLVYNESLQSYLIKDHASLHGTFLNGQRLSKSKKMSDFFRIEHLDELVIGDTTFSCHIHPGNDTCSGCEPGLVQSSQQSSTDLVVYSKAEKEKLRRQEMKEIRKKYGLQGDQFSNQSTGIPSKYSDKAEERRKTIGSDNPYQKHEAASVHVPISERNLGHKLLTKMGWKEGQGIGRTPDAITEPVQATIRSHQSAGLGSFASASYSLDDVKDARRSTRWTKAHNRYHGNRGQSSKSENGRGSNRMTFIQGATLAPKPTKEQSQTERGET